MRIKFFGRVLAATTGLVILFVGLCVLIFGLGIFPFRIDLGMLEGPFELWHRLVMVAVALVLCALGIHSISILFRRNRDRGFIIQHTEYGDMSISMQAMENMVKKCIDTHEELKVTRTRIHRTRDGVVVNIRISLANGVNIPLTVNALQKQIKHYITSCSGVDVKEVRVMVETGNQSPKSAEVIAPDLFAADASVTAKAIPTPLDGTAINAAPESKEPIHQRIFKQEEAPNIVPPPPAEERQTEDAKGASVTEDAPSLVDAEPPPVMPEEAPEGREEIREPFSETEEDLEPPMDYGNVKILVQNDEDEKEND